MSAAQGVSHVFFEVGGVLIDHKRFGGWYAESVGRVMAARFGLTPETWSAAYRHVLIDWDSYYADLNLSGDDGMADLWEGMFRTTRALFRIVERAEPGKAALTALARELPALASRGHAAFYPDARETLRALDAGGLTLGIVSYATSAQLEALLEPARDCFKGAIWGADKAERFEKDGQRYRLAADDAGAAPGSCLVVDTQAAALDAAAQAGMQTAHICRKTHRDGTIRDLRGLVERLGLRD